jgi:hypothetical protein
MLCCKRKIFHNFLMPNSRRNLYIILSPIILITAFSFGFSWGNVGNHHTYMIHPLSMLNDNFAVGDWFTYDTRPYHPSFSYFVIFLSTIAPLPWITAIANTILIAIGLLFIIDIIIRLSSDEDRFFAVGFVFALIWITKTWYAGQSYIFSDGLQPSSISATCYLASMAYFLRKEMGKSGFFLGLGGIFHANFLVLGIAAFGLAQVLLGINNIWKRIICQVGPSIIILIINSSMLFSASIGHNAQEARYIFQFIRSPFHYVPLTFAENANLCLLWIIFGIWSGLRVKDKDLRKNVLCLLLALSLPVVIGYIFTTIVFIPVVSQIFVFRLLPFAILLSIILQSVYAAEIMMGKENIGWAEIIEVGISVLMILLSIKGILGYLARFIVLIGFLGNAAGISMLLYNRIVPGKAKFRLALSSLAVILALVYALPSLTAALRHTLYHSYLLHPELHSPQLDLYKWARNTPIGTKFLVPPGLREFRLMSEKAVVADWSATPAFGPGLVEWYNRMCIIAGRDKIESSEVVTESYKNMTNDRLRLLKQKYLFDYAVFEDYIPPGVNKYPVIYQSGKYYIVKISLL